jgi:hypothetical protein
VVECVVPSVGVVPSLDVFKNGHFGLFRTQLEIRIPMF